jgi:hypothetical protein
MSHPVDPWPIAATGTVGHFLKGKFTLDRTTFIPNPEKRMERTLQKSHVEGELCLGEGGIWTRTQQAEMPWDEVRVHRKGQKPIQFQVDAKDQMTIQPAGLIRPEGTSGFFIGELFGWSDLSVGGSPKWSLPETLAQFRFKGVEKGVYRGVSPKGAEVEIVTDIGGARIRKIVFREKIGSFETTRGTQYSRWNKMGAWYVPMEGVSSIQVRDPLSGYRESDVTGFRITGLRVDKDREQPPFQEGMIFRELRTGGKPLVYRYEKGKYVPTTDPGSVFIPGRLKTHESSSLPALLILLVLVAGIGLMWRNYRRHQRLPKA